MPKISSITCAAIFVAACISTSAAYAGNSMVCTDSTTGEAYTAMLVGGKIKLKSQTWSANLTIVTGQKYGITEPKWGLYTTKVNKNNIYTQVSFKGSLLINFFKKGHIGGAYRQDHCSSEVAYQAPATRAYSVLDGIKSKCAGEWPGDYRMQKYCIDRQIEAYNALLSY